MPNTTISIKKETRELLQEYGKKSENYDDIIRRMYNNILMRDRLREFVSENEYSTLEEAKEWTRMKLAENDKDYSA
ncbi:MAG: hypothetical protein ACLFNK_00895 [Candidatus Woesearchaeota archaeon]